MYMKTTFSFLILCIQIIASSIAVQAQTQSKRALPFDPWSIIFLQHKFLPNRFDSITFSALKQARITYESKTTKPVGGYYTKQPKRLGFQEWFEAKSKELSSEIIIPMWLAPLNVKKTEGELVGIPDMGCLWATYPPVRKERIRGNHIALSIRNQLLFRGKKLSLKSLKIPMPIDLEVVFPDRLDISRCMKLLTDFKIISYKSRRVNNLIYSVVFRPINIFNPVQGYSNPKENSINVHIKVIGNIGKGENIWGEPKKTALSAEIKLMPRISGN